jgi:hypothetical protein
VSRRPWLRAAALFALAMATVAAIAHVVGAHDTDFLDPNDTRGRLDVKQVRLAHKPGPPAWTMVTFGEWTVRKIWDRGYLMVFLDTEGRRRAEYYLLVRSTGSELEGSLWRVRAVGPDSWLRRVPVWRNSRSSASVQVGLSRLTFGPHRTFYRWWVHTTLTSAVCRRTCQDRAPNVGSVRQWRPGMSPAPTETGSADS